MSLMNSIKAIRTRLEVTQGQLAAGIGVSQGNVSFYERGQGMPATVAAKLIAFAAQRGVALTYDDIYGEARAGVVDGVHS